MLRKDIEAPLSKYYPIQIQFRQLLIPSLKCMAAEEERKLFNRIVNAMRRANYSTIDQVMRMTYLELMNMKGMGAKSEDLLLELLQRAIENPTKISAANKAELIRIRMREQGFIV